MPKDSDVPAAQLTVAAPNEPVRTTVAPEPVPPMYNVLPASVRRLHAWASSAARSRSS